MGRGSEEVVIVILHMKGTYTHSKVESIVSLLGGLCAYLGKIVTHREKVCITILTLFIFTAGAGGYQ